MRLYKWMLFAFALISHPAMAQMSGYEYWLDGDYDKRTFVENTDGKVVQDLDVSNLLPGIHRYHFRAQDERGRWSVPFVRYFLRIGQHYTDNTMQGYEYWLDGDYESRTKGQTSDGMIQLELPTDDLSYGLHRFTFRAQDSGGSWSAPLSKYFVKVEPSLSDNQIVAYEYWFNSGWTTRVDVTPANPFSTEDLWIDIAGVVPNFISEEYTVDWKTNTAYCPDNVVFGIQFADKMDNRTEARTDTFEYQVPVTLDFQSLAWNDSAYIVNPQLGEIHAYEVNAENGDSLVWNIGGVCQMDIYAENGERLYRLNSSKGSLEHKMEMTYSGRTFALVYNVKTDSTSVCCQRTFTTDITSVETNIRISTEDNNIVITGAEGWSCAVCHLQGYTAEQRSALRYKEQIPLPKGIYIVRLTNKKGNTYIQKVNIP